jgi:hypothetical protein
MGLELGSGSISKVYLGSTAINKAYLGSTEIFSTASGGPFSEHPTLATGLQAYWKLESDGSDSTANSNDLTVNGATNTAGFIGNAYDLDGINDYLLSSQTPIINNWKGGTYSISAWINLDTTSGDQVIYGEGKSSSDANFARFYHQNGGNLFVSVRGPSTNDDMRVDTSGNLSQNTWHHVVLVVDGDLLACEMYVDGVSQSTRTGQNESSTEPSGMNRVALGILCRQSIGNYFNGTIDEVGVWSKALSSSEVSDLYNSGAGLTY